MYVNVCIASQEPLLNDETKAKQTGLTRRNVINYLHNYI
jgi:hypothetical protein